MVPQLGRMLETAREMLEKHPAKGSWRSPEGIFYGSGPVERAGSGNSVSRPRLPIRRHAPRPGLPDACHAQHPDRGRPGLWRRRLRLGDFLYPPAVFRPEDRQAQEAALRATEIAQPALGAVSLGAWRVLESFGVVADAAIGHSFGELTALCAAGRIDPEALLHVCRVRVAADLMADARNTGRT